MKINRLELIAFGPFSGQILDFSSVLPGLHIVYGPNEAGKSSAMRALQALFFGFPVRTCDNFLHQNPQLLVGGSLQGSNGKELTFFRRKRTLKDMFDRSDNPIEPSALTPYLHGLDRNLYTALYGIDHETLVSGGQGILDQQGEVGKALFAAGAGLASLKPFMDELEAEGETLFRPQGSSKAINEALARHKALNNQYKEAILSCREWEEHHQDLEEAFKKLADLQNTREKLKTEHHRFERLTQALPDLSDRNNLLFKLTELGTVRTLPPLFSERRTILEQSERDARLHYEQEKARSHVLREKMSGLSLNRAFLDEADAIEKLHERLGEYLKAGNDRPQRDGQRIASRSAAANLLRQIKPELTIQEVESLRPGLSKRRSVHNLASRYQALLQASRQARIQVEDGEKAIEKAGIDLQKLLPVIDTAMLSPVLSVAERAGDLDRDIVNLGQDRAIAQRECHAALHRLGLWKGPLELTAHLALPLPETVTLFDEEFRVISNKQRQLNIEKEALEKERAEVVEQLHHIEFATDVPTEAELTRHRNRRNAGWLLLRRQWIQHEDVAEESRNYDPRHPLPEAYEQQVTLSDQIADRLYREADRVQQHASLKRAIEKIEKRLADIGDHEAVANTTLNEVSCRWKQLWCSFEFTPLSPGEMRAWIGSFENLRLQARECEKYVRDEALKLSRRRELKNELAREIEAIQKGKSFPGEELNGILLYAREVMTSAVTQQKQYELIEAKILDLKTRLENAKEGLIKTERELKQWSVDWSDAVTPLGLNIRTLPTEAIDFIDTLQECFDKLKEAEEFRKRIEGIDRDAASFETDVKILVNKIATDLSALDARSAVNELKSRLGRATQEEAVLQRDAEELDTLDNAMLKSEKVLQSCREEMVSMLQFAGCTAREELIEMEERSSHYTQLNNTLLEVERRLTRLAEGMAIADFEVQADTINPDELPGRIERLNDEINKLDPEIQLLSESIGRKKSELERMNGSGRAAELAEDLQHSLTKIRRLTERYIRVKIAAKILSEETERYRRENQGPVLGIASRYFAQLTLGSFTGLRTDVDDHGQMVLAAIRPNGNWLQTAAMSSGTRDQLYLALRLASLEWRIESSEPMPFIVDDILINFDDQRSAATINALCDLAAKTQVIMFTHHKKIVETARELDATGKLFIHQLGT